MLSRLLRHWTRLPLSGRVSGRRPPASKFDHRSQMTTSLSEWTRESGYGSWTFNATLSFSTGLNVPGTSPRSFEKGQNGGMSQTLSSEEIAVLTILQEAFPEKLHLHQLAPRMALDADPTKLLGIVDALFVRGLVEGRPLRDSSGLADAANMLISGTGTATLNNLAAKTKERRTPTPLPPVQASILHVLIASPSDVSAERDAVVSAIQEWNSSHYIRTGIMLHPVRWETHSYPAAGDRPQGLLNRQIVESAHFLIGIFGNRLGTPTGEAESGTIEEIEQLQAGTSRCTSRTLLSPGMQIELNWKHWRSIRLRGSETPCTQRTAAWTSCGGLSHNISQRSWRKSKKRCVLVRLQPLRTSQTRALPRSLFSRDEERALER
jgi:hypothetical protein